MGHHNQFWNHIYRKHHAGLQQVCARYVGPGVAAEDVVQETFLRAMAGYHTYQGKGPLEAWLRRIAVNTALMHLRKRKRNPEESLQSEELPQLSVDPHQEEPTTPRYAIEQADFTKEELVALLARLPEKYRLVFNLYVFEGLKHREIAERLGISPGTSKSNLARARKNLEKILYLEAQSRPAKEKKHKAWFWLLLPGTGSPYGYLRRSSLAKGWGIHWLRSLGLVGHAFTGSTVGTGIAAALVWLSLSASLWSPSPTPVAEARATDTDATLSVSSIRVSEDSLKKLEMKKTQTLAVGLLTTMALVPKAESVAKVNEAIPRSLNSQSLNWAWAAPTPDFFGPRVSIRQVPLLEATVEDDRTQSGNLRSLWDRLQFSRNFRRQEPARFTPYAAAGSERPRAYVADRDGKTVVYTAEEVPGTDRVIMQENYSDSAVEQFRFLKTYPMAEGSPYQKGKWVVGLAAYQDTTDAEPEVNVQIREEREQRRSVRARRGGAIRRQMIRETRHNMRQMRRVLRRNPAHIHGPGDTMVLLEETDDPEAQKRTWRSRRREVRERLKWARRDRREHMREFRREMRRFRPGPTRREIRERARSASRQARRERA